eukprot:COSAG02_NODE_174_length_31243_cov_76.084543_19_plen_198_part_00
MYDVASGHGTRACAVWICCMHAGVKSKRQRPGRDVTHLRTQALVAMTLVSLRSFLHEAGLVGYEHALKEAGISTANDILEVEKPLELLELSCLEEQCVAGSSISYCSCCTLHAARCSRRHMSRRFPHPRAQTEMQVTDPKPGRAPPHRHAATAPAARQALPFLHYSLRSGAGRAADPLTGAQRRDHVHQPCSDLPSR